MRSSMFAIATAATLCWTACPNAAWAGTGSAPQPVVVAIAGLSYTDTSGEVLDQRAQHRERLEAFASALLRDLEGSGKYRIVPMNCGAAPCTAGTEASELQKAARTAGAKLVVTGGVHKMSTLVQWAKIEIADEDEGRVVFERTLTFRGDTDLAWQRAETFTARQILEALPELGTPAGSSPLQKIAVFDFELEDFSPAAGLIPASADDIEQLKRATEEVRRLLAQSPGYTVVDADSADQPAGKPRELRNCDGCEAALAAKLGAGRSLLGIVTRISRTDYAVTFKLRDAGTGELIAVEQTDLRMGANHSWNRGAAWLVKNRLLAKESRQ